MTASRLRHLSRLLRISGGAVLLTAGSCPIVPTAKTFDASTHHQLWTISLFDASGRLSATVITNLGSTGNGTFSTDTPWTLMYGNCQYPMNVVTGSMNGSLMSFTTSGSGCNELVQGSATGRLNGTTADNSTSAAGTMHVSFKNTRGLGDNAENVNWTAARR